NNSLSNSRSSVRPGWPLPSSSLSKPSIMFAPRNGLQPRNQSRFIDSQRQDRLQHQFVPAELHQQGCPVHLVHQPQEVAPVRGELNVPDIEVRIRPFQEGAIHSEV